MPNPTRRDSPIDGMGNAIRKRKLVSITNNVEVVNGYEAWIITPGLRPITVGGARSCASTRDVGNFTAIREGVQEHSQDGSRKKVQP